MNEGLFVQRSRFNLLFCAHMLVR